MANHASSNDRRITVLPSLWPKLQEFAEQDGLSVANVVNAILLQNLRPYGGCAAFSTPAQATASIDALTLHQSPARSQQQDPYQTADIDSW